MTENKVISRPEMRITGLRPPRKKCFTFEDIAKLTSGNYPNGINFDDFERIEAKKNLENTNNKT